MALEMLLERFPPNLAPVATLILLALLVLAAGFDIAQRKVPNTLILVGITTALSLSTLSGWPAISGAVIGSLAALVILLPVYASGMMGAGDVKLISMVGGFLGPHHFLFALLCIFVAGGALSILYLWHQRFKASSSGMPYAVAVLGGVTAYLSAL